MVNRIKGKCGWFLKSPVACLLPFLDPGSLLDPLNCQLVQPWTQTSSAWHQASSCWGSSPYGHSCRQHPLQASMGGWEEHLRMFFPYFHRITGVLQVLAGARLLPCDGQGSRGVNWGDEPRPCGAHCSATLNCGTVPSLPDSPAYLEPMWLLAPGQRCPGEPLRHQLHHDTAMSWEAAAW